MTGLAVVADPRATVGLGLGLAITPIGEAPAEESRRTGVGIKLCRLATALNRPTDVFRTGVIVLSVVPPFLKPADEEGDSFGVVVGVDWFEWEGDDDKSDVLRDDEDTLVASIFFPATTREEGDPLLLAVFWPHKRVGDDDPDRKSGKGGPESE